MSVIKRFIAGARCPQCQVEDKVRQCRDGEDEWLECVACGYEGKPQPPEFPTNTASDEIAVVKMVPPKG